MPFVRQTGIYGSRTEPGTIKMRHGRYGLQARIVRGQEVNCRKAARETTLGCRPLNRNLRHSEKKPLPGWAAVLIARISSERTYPS